MGYPLNPIAVSTSNREPHRPPTSPDSTRLSDHLTSPTPPSRQLRVAAPTTNRNHVHPPRHERRPSWLRLAFSRKFRILQSRPHQKLATHLLLPGSLTEP